MADEEDTVVLYYPTKQKYKLRSFKYRLDTSTGVAIASYNTPKNLNALTRNQRQETFLVLEHARQDARVRCLVWTGTGRAFNAGMSLKGMQHTQTHVPAEAAAAYAARDLAPDESAVLKTQTLAFWDFPKPIVMAVNGLAVGGGANIALMNLGDYVICSTAARFMYPFAKLKLTPELGSSFMMPLLVGMARAKEMMMLGDWFDAEAAYKLGLCNQVCDPEDLMRKAVQIATRLARNDPRNMLMMKKLMNAPLRRQFDLVLDMESRYNLQSPTIKTIQQQIRHAHPNKQAKL